MERTETRIKFLTLNLFLRPPPICTNESDYKDPRCQYFASSFLCRYDIVCLQEVFSALSNRRKRLIEKAFEFKFKYIAESPDPPLVSGCVLDCGVLILSKFPIIEQDFFPYQESLHPDRSTFKGLLYAKIDINGSILNVFTSHLQSKHPTNSSKKYLNYRLIRRTQIREIAAVVSSKVRPGESTIIAGDLNVDGREELKPPPFPDIVLDDYQCLVEILAQSLPFVDVLRTKYGVTPATFGRIGEDGKALETVLTKDDQTMWDEGLDHIFFHSGAGVEVDWEQVRVEPFYTPRQVFTQISDHAGVQAALKF